MPSNAIFDDAVVGALDRVSKCRPRPTTVSTRPPAVTIRAVRSGPRARVKHRARRRAPPACRGRRSAGRSDPRRDSPATPARRRRASPALTAIARRSSVAVRGRRQTRRELPVDQRHDDLRFGIAEPHVELDHLRAVAGQHQAGVEEAAILVPLGAHAAHHRVDDLAHDARLHRGVDQRARRERAHPAGVRSLVVVEDALVVLRRRQRHRAAAVADREERDFGPVRHSSSTTPRAGVAELTLLHRGAQSPRPPSPRSAATTTPLPAARPSALTTTGNPSSPTRDHGSRLAARCRRRDSARSECRGAP